ncbi:hypothetical protein AAIG96_33230, partial [Pseudomonas aeruginosa]
GKSGVFLVAFCARLKTYGAFFGDKNHKAFSRFCLCGHEKSGLATISVRSCYIWPWVSAKKTHTATALI